MSEISKKDWKHYRECLPIWQEHYMEKLTKEYVELLTSPGNASEHFWALDKRIREDRRYPGVIIQVRKSSVIWDIAYFIKDKVITMEDLDGFSQELIDEVNHIFEKPHITE